MDRGFWLRAFPLICILLVSNFSFISIEEEMEIQALEEHRYVSRELDEMSVIELGYTSIFLTDHNLTKSEELLDRIVDAQKKTGEIGDTVNPKLSTGLCVFSLIVGYEKTGKEIYKDTALKGGAFLIQEIEKWKEINKVKITEISKNARHEGNPQSSLECYYWTSPNDLGIMVLGIGALVPYDEKYRKFAVELGDALWKMQLENGGWYDGYTRVPIRRDQSSWYVVMAMMGLWQCYNVLGEERHLHVLLEAEEWFETMWDGGSVYDILAYEENYTIAREEGKVIGEPSGLRFDYHRYEETNERDYVASSTYTHYYGEHSFLLSNALLMNLGIEPNRKKLKKTLIYIERTREKDPSNWFLFSLWLVQNRE